MILKQHIKSRQRQAGGSWEGSWRNGEMARSEMAEENGAWKMWDWEGKSISN